MGIKRGGASFKIRHGNKRLKISRSSGRTRFSLRLGNKSKGSSGNTAIETSRGLNAPAVTTYHEARLNYMRKRAPSSVRRSARRFARRAESAIQHNWPTSALSGSFITNTSTATNSQASAWFPLLSNNIVGSAASTVYEGINSMFQASLKGNAATLLDPSSSGFYIRPASAAIESKILVKNSTLDLIIKSGSTNDQASIVKVYHIWCRKNNVFDAQHDFISGFQDRTMLDGSSPNPQLTPYRNQSSTQIGATPFDSPLFCRNWLIKSCREFLLVPNAAMTLQLRDRRQYLINGDELYTDNTATGSFASLAKYTEGYLVVWFGAQSDSGTPATNNLSFNAAVNYRYSSPAQQFPTCLVGP